MSRTTRIATAFAVAMFLEGAVTFAQDWPEIYDPLVLRTYNLEMSNEDWQTIQNDETFDIEVPTLLWLDGEAPILVSIRRKSADPLNNAPGFSKVSYKIDINELVSGQNWHGLRAVSLDNGDDENVVSEGLAWYLHRVASIPQGYGYDAGLASWVRLIINGVDTGVYVSAEQRDKRFLENRGLWIEDETWLYEVEDINGQELDEGGPEDSPLLMALCYSPFASPSSCPTPDAATLAADLPPVINMAGLLTLGAVDSFSANSDAIFSHGKNFYFVDYLQNQQRLYLPWDLDSVLGGGVNDDVYAPRSAYSAILLGVPEFRSQYSQILNDLVCGPFRESELHAFLDALEPVLSDALEADPNNQIGGSVAEFFAGRKAWFSQRIVNVTSQIEGFVPCVDVCDPEIESYCTGKTTSQGCVPFMSSSGAPNATSGAFQVITNNLVEGDTGIFLYGFNKGSLGFHGGTLCVKAPFTRLSSLIKFTDGEPCSGCAQPSCRTAKRNFNQLIQAGTDPMLTPGQRVNVQFRQRDTDDPTGFNDNLSDGLSFLICP